MSYMVVPYSVYLLKASVKELPVLMALRGVSIFESVAFISILRFLAKMFRALYCFCLNSMWLFIESRPILGAVF